MIQLLGAIVRGLRARALLSAGSVLLTALAIGSAVLGPVFSEAVTNSYVVTRLQETAPGLTGLSRVFTPDEGTDLEQAEADARAATTSLDEGPWHDPVLTVQSSSYSALRGVVSFWSREGACETLEVEGRCPQAEGEVLMLAADAEKTGAEIGKPLPLIIYEPDGVRSLGLPRPQIDRVTVVGTYTTPETGEDWLIPGRLTTQNEQTTINGGYTPYTPSPLITTPETVVASGGWTIGVDTHLDVRSDITPAELDVAARSAAVLTSDKQLDVEGGTLRDNGTNSLADVVKEVRFQQATARGSIAPAVLSLVLVALALRLRLLNAASELRVPELALASLRGVTARRLWGLGLAEPVVILLLATPLGVAFGLGLSVALVRGWLVPGLPLPFPWS
ncbi:MAG TPA: hypothetical protein VGD39_02340, partial [Nocardioides sp.]